MEPIETTATNFHHDCMTSKGWEVCRQYCTPDATFTHEGEMFDDIHTLEQYAGIVQTFFTPVPDFRHEVLSVGVDERQQRVLIHYLIRGTHTGEGFPIPPTGKSVETSCFLALHFESGRIVHAAKVWNDHDMQKQAGWI